MAQFWRTKEFNNLARAWEEKLEDAGFEDAEIQIRGERVLKQKATNVYRQAPELERESRLEYYCFLSHLTQNSQFPNDLEKLIMDRHAEGRTIKEIVDEIKLIGQTRDRKTVRFIIRRWQTTWGVRSWSLRQMNLKAK